MRCNCGHEIDDKNRSRINPMMVAIHCPQCGWRIYNEDDPEGDDR